MTRLEIQTAPYTPTLRHGLWRLLLSVTSIIEDGTPEPRMGEAEKLMRCATSTNTRVTVALYQDQVVAYAEEHRLGSHRMHLHRMATHRDFRNRQVFTQLLEAVTNDTSTSIEADINPERRHYRTMQQFGFIPDGRPSRETGMISIVRPKKIGIARLFTRS